MPTKKFDFSQLALKLESLQCRYYSMSSGVGLKVRAGGYSIIELIFSMAILAVVAMALISVNVMTARGFGDTIDHAAIELYKTKIIQTIRSDTSWRRTLVCAISPGGCCYEIGDVSHCPQNLSMSCLVTPGTTCSNTSPSTAQPFALFNASAVDDETWHTTPQVGPVYDSSLPNAGLTKVGKRCFTFPSNNCPFRFDLRWYALSTDPSPLIGVFARLQTANGLSISNVSRFSIGIFNPATNQVINPLVRSAY